MVKSTETVYVDSMTSQIIQEIQTEFSENVKRLSQQKKEGNLHVTSNL